MWLSIIDESRLCAEVTACRSPARPTCSIGSTWAATSCCSLDAKHRAYGRFPNDAGGRAANTVQGLRQANGHRFPFTEWRGVDRGHEHEAALRPIQCSCMHGQPTFAM